MQIKYFASVPYPEVTTQLERFAAAGLGLEIAVLDPHWILEVCELPMAAKLGQTLKEREIAINVQGPFLDLAPGSLDPFIREHTRKLFLRTVEIAGSLNARNLTLYSGYNPLLHSKVLDQWYEVCLPFWGEIADFADRHGVRLCIANMFEEDPEVQLQLIEGSSLQGTIGACFDVANAFGCSRKKIHTWIGALAPYLYLVYLGDVRSRESEHRPLEKSKVPYKEFFQICMKKELEPDLVFKMPAEESLESLQTIRKLGLGQLQMELL